MNSDLAYAAHELGLDPITVVLSPREADRGATIESAEVIGRSGAEVWVVRAHVRLRRDMVIERVVVALILPNRDDDGHHVRAAFRMRPVGAEELRDLLGRAVAAFGSPP